MTNFDIFLSEAKFASFAEVAALEENDLNLDKSKSVIQKSLNETQLMFDSLMQAYFG